MQERVCVIKIEREEEREHVRRAAQVSGAGKQTERPLRLASHLQGGCQARGHTPWYPAQVLLADAAQATPVAELYLREGNAQKTVYKFNLNRNLIEIETKFV